jgi:hypothetical protein
MRQWFEGSRAPTRRTEGGDIAKETVTSVDDSVDTATLARLGGLALLEIKANERAFWRVVEGKAKFRFQSGHGRAPRLARLGLSETNPRASKATESKARRMNAGRCPACGGADSFNPRAAAGDTFTAPVSHDARSLASDTVSNDKGEGQ